MAFIRKRLVVALSALVLALAPVSEGQAAELLWYGQSAFKLVTDTGKVILIDPFITDNPVTPEPLKDLSALGPVDLILLTHAHGDHVGDTAEIVRRTGAKVGVNADFGHTLRLLGVVPGDNLVRFNKSGPIQPLGDGVTITMVHAEHSSEYLHDSGGEQTIHPGGEPVGYMIRLENGQTLYHAGDTGLFSDMALLGDYYQPDLSLLPIGGHFTMDPTHAAFAITNLLKVDRVVPIHYGTFPPLMGTPQALKEALGGAAVEVIALKPGESLTF